MLRKTVKCERYCGKFYGLKSLLIFPISVCFATFLRKCFNLRKYQIIASDMSQINRLLWLWIFENFETVNKRSLLESTDQSQAWKCLAWLWLSTPKNRWTGKLLPKKNNCCHMDTAQVGLQDLQKLICMKIMEYRRCPRKNVPLGCLQKYTNSF